MLRHGLGGDAEENLNLLVVQIPTCSRSPEPQLQALSSLPGSGMGGHHAQRTSGAHMLNSATHPRQPLPVCPLNLTPLSSTSLPPSCILSLTTTGVLLNVNPHSSSPSESTSLPLPSPRPHHLLLLSRVALKLLSFSLLRPDQQQPELRSMIKHSGWQTEC